VCLGGVVSDVCHGGINTGYVLCNVDVLKAS
jgi:hypothetical protein